MIAILLLACSTPQDGQPAAQPPETVSVLSGEVTWSVDYDADAEAMGAKDCTYTRNYEALEDWTRPWLCLDCDVIWAAAVTLVDGADCYAGITGTPLAEPQETLGRSGQTWMRGSAANAPLLEQGTVTEDGEQLLVDRVTDPVNAPGGGTLVFSIHGVLELSEVEGDGWLGLEPPAESSCGWELTQPPAYDGDYELSIGQLLPDGVFLDRCEEPVRLHQLGGSYLVLDISAMDCPPCQVMAREMPDFLDRMAALSIPTRTVTLLAPRLSGVFDPTSTDQLQSWAEGFELDEPVLGDRGWGYAIGEGALGEGFAYPTAILVSPELEVIELFTGFSSYQPYQDAIVAHEQSRR